CPRADLAASRFRTARSRTRTCRDRSESRPRPPQPPTKNPQQRKAMASTLDRIAKDVGHLLKVVGAITGVPEGPKQLLATLGWDLPPGVNDIGLAAVDLESVAQSAERLQQAFDTNAGDEVIAARAAELIVEI